MSTPPEPAGGPGRPRRARRRGIAQLDPIVLRIRDRMSELGMTHRQLAARSGLSVATISNMINGVNDPSLMTIRFVCTVLDLQVIVVRPPRRAVHITPPPPPKLLIPTKESGRAHW